MNQRQAALIVKLGLTDEQIGTLFPDVAPRHYGVVREWGAKGGEIEVKDAGGDHFVRLRRLDPMFTPSTDYRLAPRTVTITGPGGTFEIPEPVREPLKDGVKYWCACIENVTSTCWDGCQLDKTLMSQGRIHLTEEAAQAHADALAKLMQKEGK